MRMVRRTVPEQLVTVMLYAPFFKVGLANCLSRHRNATMSLTHRAGTGR